MKQEDRVMKAADVDFSGSLSLKEAVNYLHACVVVGSALPDIHKKEWDPASLSTWAGAFDTAPRMLHNQTKPYELNLRAAGGEVALEGMSLDEPTDEYGSMFEGSDTITVDA